MAKTHTFPQWLSLSLSLFQSFLTFWFCHSLSSTTLISPSPSLSPPSLPSLSIAWHCTESLSTGIGVSRKMRQPPYVPLWRWDHADEDMQKNLKSYDSLKRYFMILLLQCKKSTWEHKITHKTEPPKKGLEFMGPNTVISLLQAGAKFKSYSEI